MTVTFFCSAPCLVLPPPSPVTHPPRSDRAPLISPQSLSHPLSQQQGRGLLSSEHTQLGTEAEDFWRWAGLLTGPFAAASSSA